MVAKKSNEYYPEVEAVLIENIHDKNTIFNSLKVVVNLIRDDKKRFIL